MALAVYISLQVLQNSGLDLKQLDVYEQLEFVPFDPTVKRTEGTLKGPDGKVFKTTKGERSWLLLAKSWHAHGVASVLPSAMYAYAFFGSETAAFNHCVGVWHGLPGVPPDTPCVVLPAGAPHIIMKLVQVDADDISKRVHWKVR
jgi:hypothetical protein